MTTNDLIEDASPRLRQFLVSLEEFEQNNCIGEGAFGKVFLGVHKPTGTECAIKLLLAQKLKEKDRADFLRENSIMATCNDLFLLPFMGWTATPPYAIITQFCPNKSLFDALRGKPGTPELTPTLKTIIMIGVAHGMMELHRKKVIHRDLKSLNILLDERCFPKVCDFGLSLIDNEVAVKQRDVGTPHWMAPELFETNDYTNKVDVYAYAITMWELLTGSTPYKGKNPEQIQLAVCKNGERPSFPRGAPKDICSFIRSCWNQDPRKRPTFKQIYSLLAKKTLIFPGTDMNELDFFFQQIAEDETNRKAGKGIGVQPLGNPLFIATMTQGIKGKVTPDQPNPTELGNTHYQYYEANFKMCMKLYTKPESVKQFFDMLVPAVVNDITDKITPFVLTHCLRLIVKEQYCFNAFFSSKLFGAMPSNRKESAPSVLNILNVYFSKRPDLMSTDILMFYSPLTEIAPHKMIKIIMLNLQYFGQYANGWDVCNFFIYISPTMIKSDYCSKYIDILLSMLKKYEQFATQYLASCIQIFIAAVQQYNPENSDTAYSAIIALNNPRVLVAPDVLARSLATSGCEKGALCYMLTAAGVISTPEIIDRLFTLAATNKEAMALLLLFAERKDTFANFFPEYQGVWMIDGRVTLEESVHIVAIIMCHKEFRPYFIHVAQVTQWLCMLAQSTTSHTLAFTPILLEKLGLTKEIVDALSHIDYFKNYIDNVLGCKDKAVYEATINLIDSASRLSYVSGFVKFDPKLVEIGLNDKKLSLGAISALAMRSMSGDGKKSIKSLSEFPKLLKTYETDAKAKPFIDILKKNCT